jgi:hypothetical protein
MGGLDIENLMIISWFEGSKDDFCGLIYGFLVSVLVDGLTCGSG